MVISGYTIDGDPDGLRFLRANRDAIIGLIDIVRKQGTAAFMYQDKRYVIFPSPNDTYIVAESGGRRHASRKTENILNKKYI